MIKVDNKIKQKRTAEREEKRKEREINEKALSLSDWIPKTELGKKVKNGEITSIEEIFAKNLPILEPEIVDSLVDLQEEVIDIKKTSRVVRAGRKFAFRTSVLVGNKNGLIGLGTAKDTEKWPAVEKAKRKARLNLVRIRRGCGSWECPCHEQHSVPFKVEGKCASVRVTLLPAPKGVGLVAGDNIKKVLEFAGIKDVWSRTAGATKTTLNFALAAIDALSNTAKMRVSEEISRKFAKNKKE